MLEQDTKLIQNFYENGFSFYDQIFAQKSFTIQRHIFEKAGSVGDTKFNRPKMFPIGFLLIHNVLIFLNMRY